VFGDQPASQPVTGQLHHVEIWVPSLEHAIAFPERHPHAGGEDHYAAYLVNADGYEVELVASPPGPAD
jgi:hypothetical protein